MDYSCEKDMMSGVTLNNVVFDRLLKITWKPDVQKAIFNLRESLKDNNEKLSSHQR
jgi:hypothetical protein